MLGSMKILVTGSAGFIGSALCNQLGILGHKLVLVDNFSDFYDVSLKEERVKSLLYPLGLEVIDLDISSKSKLDNLVKIYKPDIVVNLAAQAGVRLDMQENHKYIDSNILGFNNVLVSCLEHKVPYFLYASSSSVYGDSSAVPYTETETHLRPNSFYGVTKLSNELTVNTLVKNTSTRARGLRFFTVYGPWGRPDMVYFRMISNVISGSELQIYGDGTIARDFTFIDDVVNSIISLVSDMQNRGNGFIDIVNIGGGMPHSINHLIEVVEDLTRKKVVFNRMQRNLNDIQSTLANHSYLRSLIGDAPKTPIETGISKTITWARDPEITKKMKKWVESVG
jgi:UDP-glucuronate 4-epimerase